MNKPMQRRSRSGADHRRRAALTPDPAEAAETIRARLGSGFPLAVVLGSGFGGFKDLVDVTGELPTTGLAGWVTGSVSGHAGRVFAAKIGALSILGLAGRAHFYEGFSMGEITFPVRVLAALGVETLLLTNAAGGIHPNLRPGGFMIIRDHINLMGANPLRGVAQAGRERFLDLTTVYDPDLRGALRAAHLTVAGAGREGVYLAVSGPSYETPSEVVALRRLGADAVGMSTVPEAIVARQCGLRVAGLSLISNRAAGLGERALAHQEVLERGHAAAGVAARIIHEFVRLYARS